MAQRSSENNGGVTVVVPTFNAMDHLRACLDSVKAQQWSGHLSVVVVDDASNDGTPEFVAKAYPDVRLVRLVENVGEAVARNTGLAVASHGWVTFVDQDDVVAPHHLACLHKVLLEQGAIAVAPASEGFSEGVPAFLDSAHADDSSGEAERISYERAVAGGVSNTVFADRSTLIEAGGFNPLLRGTGDYLLLCTLARIGKLVRAKDVTYGYRTHASMSSGRYDMARHVLICRAALAAARPGTIKGNAWDVDLLATNAIGARSVEHHLGRFADTLAFARLVRLDLRGLLAVARRTAAGWRLR